MQKELYNRRRGSGVEQLIRNQRVVGSIPIAGSIKNRSKQAVILIFLLTPL